MRRTVLLAAGALGVGSLTLLASQTPRGPTFQAGVDVVQLDVTVLDKQHQPVPGLTADDFSVFEDGKPRPIVAFSIMGAPDASPSAAPWTRDVPLDVTTNQLDTHRLMVIMLDDRLIPAGMTGAAAAVATKAIDHLGPGDQAAVLFTGYGRNQNFTTDHALLRKAVASLSPNNSPIGITPKTDPGVVRRIVGLLQNAPVGRKILVVIGPLPVLGLALTDGSGLPNIRRDLQSANITVYTFNLFGVANFSPTAAASGDPRQSGFEAMGPIFSPGPDDVAVMTGGRAVAGTNDPADGVEDAFRDSRLYYLIGFDRGASADGKLHHVSVTVKRPGLEVRTRSSYVAPDGASSSAPAAARAANSAPDPVEVALARGLPSGDLPLRVVVTPVAARGGRNTVLVVGTEIGRIPSADGAPPTRRVDLVVTALDADWHARQTERQTVDISQADGAAGHEVLSRLTLAPGHYEVRVAAESDGHTGNVFADVDVPDLLGPNLALSGVFLSPHPGVPAGPRDALLDLVPVVPGTARTFSHEDRVTAFVRVYEGHSGALQPVTVTMAVVNDHNDSVFQRTAPIATSAFGGDRSADVSVDLPLGQLSRGEYVVMFKVTSGNHQQSRYERFSMN